MAGASVGIGILTGGAGQAAGSLVGPATDAGKGIYQCLKRKYYYIKNLDKHFKNLEMEARYLSGRQTDIRSKIERSQVLMERTEECATWIEDVRKLLEDVEQLKTRYQMAVNGPCWLHTRLKLSKEIVEMSDCIVNLRDRMNTDRAVLVERRPDVVEKKFPKKTNEVPSLHEHGKKLLELLGNDEIKKIGIWGMAGVGKTTILENLNDEVERLKVFDIVLCVKVSKEMNLDLIRQEILKRLGVNLQNVETERQAAGLISRTLEEKKYLLLVDEVFSEFDLREIGIHENHLHGKVVVATREKKVCNSMDTDEEIKIERLSRVDARKLFHGAVGEAVDHPVIKPIAELVLKQCGELPHVIRAVGRHLKDKFSEDFWRNTLSQLQSPKPYQLQGMEDVFNSFKLIYEELPPPLQSCLLYAISFPQDHEIFRDHLIECWRAEQLIIDQTFRRTREEGHTNLEIFIDKCLFDRCNNSFISVKIPIIFRNAARRMAHLHNCGFLLRHSDDDEESENPLDGDWVNAKVISFINSSSRVKLPPRPECSKASTLFLQMNHNLSMLPFSFFDCMSTLRILDLCRTTIHSLPPSISNLVNLKVLYMTDCYNLVHLPQEIDRLHNLHLLDICRTGMRAFPTVLPELASLRCLRLSFPTTQNSVVTSQTFHRLLHLEELTIDVDPKDENWNRIAPNLVTSVARLEKLSTLSLCFSNTESLETFIHTSKSWRNDSSQPGSNFRSFHFIVGFQEARKSPKVDVTRCSGRRYLQYAGGKGTPNVIKQVLKKSCAFELIAHMDINSISDFGIDWMECMEVFHIEECNDMTTFLSSQMLATPAFPWLRELHLINLQRLNAICQGPNMQGSFAKLTALTIYDCPNVTEVFPLELAKQLYELQNLSVGKCPQIKEIVVADNVSTMMGAFPKLKSLELEKLEGLVSIHSNDSFEWCELQNIKIIQCNKLVNLCMSTENATKLRHIHCDRAWWGTVVLNDEVRVQLQRLCSFS